MSVPGHSNDNNNVNVQTSTITTTVVNIEGEATDKTTPKKTLFGKLLNQDSEQGKFVDHDRNLASQRFGDVFFYESVNEDIYDAIACKGGTTNLQRNEASTLKFKLSIIACPYCELTTVFFLLRLAKQRYRMTTCLTRTP